MEGGVNDSPDTKYETLIGVGDHVKESFRSQAAYIVMSCSMHMVFLMEEYGTDLNRKIEKIL